MSVPGRQGKEKHSRLKEQPGRRRRGWGTTSYSEGEAAPLLPEGALALLLKGRVSRPSFCSSQDLLRRSSDLLHPFPSKLCRRELAAKRGPQESPESECAAMRLAPGARWLQVWSTQGSGAVRWPRAAGGTSVGCRLRTGHQPPQALKADAPRLPGLPSWQT